MCVLVRLFEYPRAVWLLDRLVVLLFVVVVVVCEKEREREREREPTSTGRYLGRCGSRSAAAAEAVTDLQSHSWASGAQREEREREKEREREPFPHVSTALPTEGAIAPSVLIARQVHASDSDPEAPIFGLASMATAPTKRKRGRHPSTGDTGGPTRGQLRT